MKLLFNIEKIEMNWEKKKATTHVSTIFKPKTFVEYIGQTKVKDIISSYIEGTKKRQKIFPHVLIYGPPGYGKSTLGEIISYQLNVKLREIIASNIEDEETINNLVEETESGILLIDEVHSIPREIVEKFYPVMERADFTMIGTTTELGEILKDRKPFYDRFKIIIELEDYHTEDLIKIARQYKERVFTDDVIDDDVYKILAKNCRNTPRTLIRLLESTIYFNGNVNKVLDSFNIIKDGFNTKDIKILKYISSSKEGVGLQGLATYMDTSKDNYIYEIEPFLLKNELIVRTMRGRKITEKGLSLLESIHYLKEE